MLVSLKLAPTFDYPVLEEFWRTADDLGFHGIWNRISGELDIACAEVGRDPAQIRRSVQVFLHPQQPEQVAGELAQLAVFEEAGCQHVVLSFYKPPNQALLERCAAL